MGSYLNRQDLADSLVSAVRQLRQAQGQGGGPVHSVQSAPLSARRWRMVDRLCEADIERLIAAFAGGTSKRELAKRYGISESSVKRLVRQHGVSQRSSGLRRLITSGMAKVRTVVDQFWFGCRTSCGSRPADQALLEAGGFIRTRGGCSKRLLCVDSTPVKISSGMVITRIIAF